MNGKQSKKLRRMALAMVTGPMKAKASDGYNEYNQARNCLSWKTQLDSDGLPMRDPAGSGFLKTLVQNPGTITCAWKVRVMYKALKAQWKGKAHDQKKVQ
jgi:hypothetical protein